MSKTYVPGSGADAVVERLVATGRFATPDEAVRAGIEMLAEKEAEIEELRRFVDEGDEDVAAGRIHRYATGTELVEDVMGGAKRGRKASRANR